MCFLLRQSFIRQCLQLVRVRVKAGATTSGRFESRCPVFFFPFLSLKVLKLASEAVLECHYFRLRRTTLPCDNGGRESAHTHLPLSHPPCGFAASLSIPPVCESGWREMFFAISRTTIQYSQINFGDRFTEPGSPHVG